MNPQYWLRLKLLNSNIIQIPGTAFISEDLNPWRVQLLSHMTTWEVAATWLLSKMMPQLWEHAATNFHQRHQKGQGTLFQKERLVFTAIISLWKGEPPWWASQSTRQLPVGSCRGQLYPQAQPPASTAATPRKFRLFNWWMLATMTSGGVTAEILSRLRGPFKLDWNPLESTCN